VKITKLWFSTFSSILKTQKKLCCDSMITLCNLLLQIYIQDSSLNWKKITLMLKVDLFLNNKSKPDGGSFFPINPLISKLCNNYIIIEIILNYCIFGISDFFAIFWCHSQSAILDLKMSQVKRLWCPKLKTLLSFQWGTKIINFVIGKLIKNDF
jgi:hypothetical protein